MMAQPTAQDEPLRAYMVQRKRALVTELRAVEAFLASTAPPPATTAPRPPQTRVWQACAERDTA